MTEVLEVLTKARALVDKGWLQGGWFTVTGKTGRNQIDRVCSAGAIRLAANPVMMERCGMVTCSCGCGSMALSANVSALSVQAEQVLGEVIGLHWQSIPEWNDTNGRTKEQVLAVFDEAIKRLTPPPPEPVFEGGIVALPTFGESKVTYVLDGNKFISVNVPDYVPASFEQKVLVNSA